MVNVAAHKNSVKIHKNKLSTFKFGRVIVIYEYTLGLYHSLTIIVLNIKTFCTFIDKVNIKNGSSLLNKTYLNLKEMQCEKNGIKFSVLRQ